MILQLLHMASVRTSRTHPLRIDWLDPPAPVGMTLLPGVHGESTYGFRWQRDLDSDLDELRRLGATALVCLLEDHEFDQYEIRELIPKARSRGLEVLRLAIVDGGVPRRLEEVDELLDAVDAHAAKGGRLVIHCRGGLGRTGTIAGCYLVRHGTSSGEALAMLRRVRKTDRCPEHDTQRGFIARYAEHTRAGTQGPGAARALLETVEREVARAPDGCFRFAEDGEATLDAAGRSFRAGRFETPSIGELRARAAARSRSGGGRLILSVLHGAHRRSDIGTLQATAAPGTLFQVASQFNCLEAPGPHIVPIRDYVHDNTQGPRASVSAFPGTFLRHYRAPAADGTRFVQTDGRCINLLADVFETSVAEVRAGYLRASQVREMGALASALVERFDRVRVGVHAGVEVVFGHDWSGPVPRSPQVIAQVFTSTIALGGYGHDDGDPALATARRRLLRAAYLGTLLAAVELACDTVVLTMIGGGVFANPHRDIWDAIHWALAEVEPLAGGTKQVIVNTREPVADEDRAQVRARGGTFVELDA